MSYPPIVSPEAWLAARSALLTQEKALTRQGDAVNALRRRLPMVKVTKDYVFTSQDGPRRLLDLFAGRQEEWEDSPPAWPRRAAHG